MDTDEFRNNEEKYLSDLVDKKVIYRHLGIPWEDKPSPEDKEISAAHPMHSGNHKRYQRAAELISSRHSKGSLINLVNWLLSQIEEKK